MPSNNITLGTMLTNIRDHIDEPTALYWTDAEITRAVVRRQLDLWRKILQIRRDYFLSPTPWSLATIVNQYAYTTAPGDLWRITAGRVTTSGSQDIVLRAADPNSGEFLEGLRTDVSISNPGEFLYALRNQNTLWLSPLPQSILTISFDYIALPAEVALTTDTFSMPDAFLDYVEYGATVDLLTKGPVGDSGAWNQMMGDAWQSIILGLDMPRNDQTTDLVSGMFEGT